MKDKQYWVCIIGSVEQMKLKKGADAPFRNAVETAFHKMFPKGPIEDFICWSGWGCSQQKCDALNAVWDLEDSDPYLQQIIDILKHPPQ